ncbi:MAG TPA: hypothetical protein VJI96_03925 [Candidatus Andersenbacteria bacterium]|nr:hypothetical protein [Candidatus Andersenbacteria bacterium]
MSHSDNWGVVCIEHQFDDYYAQFMHLLSTGNYGTKDANITPENFPGQCIGDFKAVLVLFDCQMKHNTAMQEIKGSNYRPATMIELLAYGAWFPDEQMEYSIAALGQSWEDPKRGPCVGSLPHKSLDRELILYPCSMPFGSKCRFLAVCEPKAKAA